MFYALFFKVVQYFWIILANETVIIESHNKEGLTYLGRFVEGVNLQADVDSNFRLSLPFSDFSVFYERVKLCSVTNLNTFTVY